MTIRSSVPCDVCTKASGLPHWSDVCFASEHEMALRFVAPEEDNEDDDGGLQQMQVECDPNEEAALEFKQWYALRDAGKCWLCNQAGHEEDGCKIWYGSCFIKCGGGNFRSSCTAEDYSENEVICKECFLPKKHSLGKITFPCDTRVKKLILKKGMPGGYNKFYALYFDASTTWSQRFELIEQLIQ